MKHLNLPSVAFSRRFSEMLGKSAPYSPVRHPLTTVKSQPNILARMKAAALQACLLRNMAASESISGAAFGQAEIGARVGTG